MFYSKLGPTDILWFLFYFEVTRLFFSRLKAFEAHFVMDLGYLFFLSYVGFIN